MSGHGKAGGRRRRSALSDAGSVLHDYLAEQHRALTDGEMALRRGDDAVVHATRVATRRLRSALRVFGVLFEPARTRVLDEELSWWAAMLGEVRDRQVLHRRLTALIATLDDIPETRAVERRIDDELRREQLEHWSALQQALDGEQYRALMDEVARWISEPPFTRRAERPAPELVRLAHRADVKVSKRLRKANLSGDVEELHRARKAAKRSRYAAEAAVSITGTVALKQARRYEALQDLLGEHQDSVVSAELLRRLGLAASLEPGAGAFTFGVLHERELEHGRQARAEARRIAKRYR